MALYIDSAFLEDIMKVVETVPVAGVTTNPTLMLQAQERGQELKPQSILSELLRGLGGIILGIQRCYTGSKFHHPLLQPLRAFRCQCRRTYCRDGRTVP